MNATLVINNGAGIMIEIYLKIKINQIQIVKKDNNDK